ncbi:MAG: beta-glucuronidase [Ruminococcaceae bacterium]|nr:beta-glucuronidase [Oscillospiraceae bacterium]
MERNIVLRPEKLKWLRSVDERLVSYNIEMTEITGGTFWKSYTPGQIAGTEEFKVSGELSDFTAMADLMQYYPPIDLGNETLRERARALGPAWIRVSGSWATKTYYDFEGTTGGRPPKGYASVLTRSQWIGVLDFVRAVGGKLLVSVSNCEGDHPDGGALDLRQTEKLFNLSHEYGVDIDAAEFMNEPNMLSFSGAPAGYTEADYARDQDIFNGWVKKHYPDCLLVGPCSLGEGAMGKTDIKSSGAGIGAGMRISTTDGLLKDTRIPLDVFSYHYYNGVSERLAPVMPGAHWDANEAHTDEYLAVARNNAVAYAKLRDKYVPGGQMWVTESGDAGGGGDTWASTYLDVFRTLNELGSFSEVTDGIIFHNTLASSDYGFLSHGSFEPRPNYYAVLLWNRLVGRNVYVGELPEIKNAHVYFRSRSDNNPGLVCVAVNNSMREKLSVTVPCEAEVFSLSGNGDLRSRVLYLNGVPIDPGPEGGLPELRGKKVKAGAVEIAPGTCVFIRI